MESLSREGRRGKGGRRYWNYKEWKRQEGRLGGRGTPMQRLPRGLVMTRAQVL